VVKIPLRGSVKKSLKGVGSTERPVGERPLMVSEPPTFRSTFPPAPVAWSMLALAIWPPFSSTRVPAVIEMSPARPDCSVLVLMKPLLRTS
jgi:hypothetical protein